VYPERRSRGLVLVKWWLLAIPQYLVVAILAGGGAAAWSTNDQNAAWGSGGLIGLLVVIAAVILAFTGAYPRPIFDLVLGLNRWVIRVVAYATLMTDRYPPFGLDLGTDEGAGASPPPTPAPGSSVIGTAPQMREAGWTPGRIIAMCLGAVVGLVSIGLLAGGRAIAWLDHTQRDASGFLTSPARTFQTSAYAITTDRIDLGSATETAPSSILGTVRIRVTASNPAQSIFVGIGRHDAVDPYLGDVRHVTIDSLPGGTTTYRLHPGMAPAAQPITLSTWVRSSYGSGTQSITWKPSGGAWTIVAMRPDGTCGLSITADVGATVAALGWIDAGILLSGSILLIAGILLITLPIVFAGRRSEAGCG
jgi:hypothetical protein